MNQPIKASSSLMNQVATTTGQSMDIGALKRNAVDRGGAEPGVARGVSYVKFDGNTGAFVHGRMGSPISEEQAFIIPLQGLSHGWVYWENNKSERDTEVRVSAFQPFPPKPDNRARQGELPRPHDRDGWSETIGMQMIGYKGPLDTFVLELSHSSQAVQRCWGDIAMAVVENDGNNPGTTFIHPVVTFTKGSYQHKSYNRTVYTLTPTIIGWTDGMEVRELSAPQLTHDAFEAEGEDEDDILN